ncbi:MAG: tetratricopeptide repeat protein [Thermosynechococcaceae cyanobacterium]
MSDPHQDSPHSLLDALEQAQSLADLGQYLDAIALLKQHLSKHPSTSTAWKLKGDYLIALKRSAEALDSYDRAISTAWFEPENWYARGRLFEQMGAYGNAVENYNRAMSLSPDPQYQEAQANIYAQKKLVLVA